MVKKTILEKIYAFFGIEKPKRELGYLLLSAMVLGLLIGGGATSIFLSQGAKSEVEAQFLDEGMAPPDSYPIEEKVILVDIRGAVKSPDVYEITEGSIVKELIELSGGLVKKVDSEWVDQNINYSLQLEDRQKIYIPFKAEVPAVNSEVETPGGGSSAVSGKVNINTGTKEELESLTGVGPSTAQKIIDGRPYKKIEDLLDVKGIGESTFEKLREYIRI